ncbi:Hypothetical predicted protein [Marmota monax]|uniref:Uncharacterized protein n=1 Tax=Marmota monax TaxID=9995 RepID=A0A5E4D6M6_MARMO|nr:Hypothetical predicted protein [Marmota monax]
MAIICPLARLLLAHCPPPDIHQPMAHCLPMDHLLSAAHFCLEVHCQSTCRLGYTQLQPSWDTGQSQGAQEQGACRFAAATSAIVECNRLSLRVVPLCEHIPGGVSASWNSIEILRLQQGRAWAI